MLSVKSLGTRLFILEKFKVKYFVHWIKKLNSQNQERNQRCEVTEKERKNKSRKITAYTEL